MTDFQASEAFTPLSQWGLRASPNPHPVGSVKHVCLPNPFLVRGEGGESKRALEEGEWYQR